MAQTLQCLHFSPRNLSQVITRYDDICVTAALKRGRWRWVGSWSALTRPPGQISEFRVQGETLSPEIEKRSNSNDSE